MLTGTDKRVAECLRLEVENLARKYGVERLGFLTLTFKNRVVCYKTAQKRWNSLVTGQLRDRYARIIATWERDKGRKIHWHAVVVLPFNTQRESFDFDASRSADREYTRAKKSALWRMFDGQRTSSACPELRAEWRWLLTVLPKYGFGRNRLEPVKGAPEALARYCAKYIGKQMAVREPSDKGARKVRYVGFHEVVTVPARGTEAKWRGRVSTRTARPEFGWASPGARVWRLKVASWAGSLGIEPCDLWLDARDPWTPLNRELGVKVGEVNLKGWQWGYRWRITQEDVAEVLFERKDEAGLVVELAVCEARRIEEAERAAKETLWDEFNRGFREAGEQWERDESLVELAEMYATEFASASFGA